MKNKRKLLMVEFFESPAKLSRYITTRKIPKRRILQIVHNRSKYLLFYYTTLKKEEKYNRKYEVLEDD